MHRLLSALVFSLLTLGPARAQDWENPFPEIPYELPAGYHDPLALTLSLQRLAERAPQASRFRIIGRTQEGRALPALTFSLENGPREAGKPRVLLVGAVHGEEAGTQEILWRFAQEFAENQARDPRLTKLASALSVTVAPVLNPDGVAKGRRTNAAGVDLNRDCPATGNPSSQENRALLELAAAEKPSLVLFFHAGGAAFVLPWDSPDGPQRPLPAGDALLKLVGHAYASPHPTLTSSSLPRALEPGVIRGHEWYPVANSLPDCLNLRLGLPAASVEVGLVRQPVGVALDRLYDENRESLLAALEVLLPSPE